MEIRTRAVKAFFIARPAAFLTCKRVLSSTRTDESINMYSGYKVHEMRSGKRSRKQDRHNFPERLSRAFLWQPDACSHLDGVDAGDETRCLREERETNRRKGYLREGQWHS